MGLVYEDGYHVEGYEIKFLDEGKTEQCIIELKRGDDVLKMESTESDVFEHFIRLHTTLNKDGKEEFRRYKDLNSYWEDAEFLADLGNTKKPEAMKRLRDGKFTFDYNPIALFEEFLELKEVSSDKYLNLKKHYYEIFAYTLSQANIVMKTQEKAAEKKHPRFASYMKIINSIIAKAFIIPKTPFKSFRDYRRYLLVDIEDLVLKTAEEISHTENMLKVMPHLGTNGSVNGKIAMPWIIDIYRRFAELSSKLINLLRLAIELTEGNENPDLKKRFEDNCEVITKYPEYKDLLEFVDPLIRHAASHITFEIDHERGMIKFFDDRSGKKLFVKEYTYQIIGEMTKGIRDGLVPALLFGIQLNELVLAMLAMDSYEYKVSLLGIGNRK